MDSEPYGNPPRLTATRCSFEPVLRSTRVRLPPSGLTNADNRTAETEDAASTRTQPGSVQRAKCLSA